MNETNVKITERSNAFKGYASSYNVEIGNSLNAELQLKDTEYEIRNKLIDLLSELRSFRFVTTLILGLKKIQSDIKHYIALFFSNSKAKTIINESEINDVFESVYTTVISNIQKSLEQG